MPDGFEWPFDEQRSCVTVFSASNYAGRTKNQGAYLLLGAPGSSVSDEEARAGAAEGTALNFPFGAVRLVQFEAAHTHEPRIACLAPRMGVASC